MSNVYTIPTTQHTLYILYANTLHCIVPIYYMATTTLKYW